MRRLIDGTDTETLAFYDVSDYQIYGRKHLRHLTGVLADAARDAGCEPTVYQSLLWWCFVFIPIVPRATYFVIPCLECDDPDGDADQYRGVITDFDARQAQAHYCVTLSLMAAIALGGWWWLA